jgi:hypothetical protein
MDDEEWDEAAHHDCDLAMGGNERGCCKSKDEELGEHVGLWWGSLKSTD